MEITSTIFKIKSLILRLHDKAKGIFQNIEQNYIETETLREKMRQKILIQEDTYPNKISRKTEEKTKKRELKKNYYNYFHLREDMYL